MSQIARINKVLLIISSALLTIVNLLKLIPWKSQTGYFWNQFQNWLMNHPIGEKIFLVFIVLLGIVVIISAILDMKKEKKIHSFETGSKEFEKYFTDWYNNQGALSIICDDLENWVTLPIEVALLEKCKNSNLNLLIAKNSPPALVDKLRNAGATIKVAPLEIVSKYSFSCITFMGDMTMAIIRDKRKDGGGNIKFEEIPHSYSTDLLNTLIEQILKNGDDLNA